MELIARLWGSPEPLSLFIDEKQLDCCFCLLQHSKQFCSIRNVCPFANQTVSLPLESSYHTIPAPFPCLASKKFHVPAVNSSFEQLSRKHEKNPSPSILKAWAITAKMDRGDHWMCPMHIIEHWGQVLPDYWWALKSWGGHCAEEHWVGGCMYIKHSCVQCCLLVWCRGHFQKSQHELSVLVSVPCSG